MMDWILVGSPTFFPNACIDGSQGGPNEGVIDTHIEFDGRRVYLPVRPIKAAARDLLGMVERSQVVSLEESLAAARARIVELETDLAEAQPVLSAMAKAAQRWGTED